MRDAVESGFFIVAGFAAASVGWLVGRINRIGHRIDRDRHTAADHRIVHEIRRNTEEPS